MASLIQCPHCGIRPRDEFEVKGAALSRPQPDAGDDAWYAYVFLRENPRGPHAEYWHHVSGCRRWLVVLRDTVTHETIEVRDVTAARSIEREAQP